MPLAEPQSSGNTGFVKTTPTRVTGQFGLWSTVKLDNEWQFISED